jgi:hypothetical protein
MADWEETWDLDRLTDEQVTELERLLRKAHPEGATEPDLELLTEEERAELVRILRDAERQEP